MEKATFGAGCFWGVEDAFRQVEGVTSTRVGYAGGTVEDPSYGEVCAGETGHTEVVEVEFDPSIVSYEQLLDLFWHNHDATSDYGRQYRSVIFTHTPEQAATARQSVERFQAGRRPVVTRIEPAPAFYDAEEYHQQYYEKKRQAVIDLKARCRIE